MSLCPHSRVLPSAGVLMRALTAPNQQRRHMSLQSANSHYDVLQIPRKATQAQVKSAYFVLSKKFHPDMDSSLEAKSKYTDIQHAYEVLGHPIKRRQYDRQFATQTADGPVTEINHPFDLDRFKRQQFSSKKGVYKMGQTDVYNYDEFYHHHYGDSIGKMKSAKTASDSQNMKENQSATHRFRLFGLLYAVLIVGAFLGRKKMM